MLTAEQAQERLKTFRIQDGQKCRSARVARLPSRLRATGFSLLACSTLGIPIQEPEATQQARARAWEELDKLGHTARLRIMEALFPGMGTPVERAWQLHHRLPYLTGTDRRSFRAPHTPRTTRPLRGSWLVRLLSVTEDYEQDVTWFAAWAPYLGWYAPSVLGLLFAAAIDLGDAQGDHVFETLRAAASGEHEFSIMGRHVPRAFLTASRPDGWEFIENLLLAAQRQEGLRQTILETIDEAHPEAFRRILRLILDHNLARFSATVRAANVWFGFQWDSVQARSVNQHLEQVLHLLEEPSAQAMALEAGDGKAVYTALWCMAFRDAIAVVEPATRLLQDPSVERRFAATHLLAQLGLVGSLEALLPALEDGDLRVVARALQAFQCPLSARIEESDLFERVEGVLARLPKRKKTLAPVLWPWMTLPADPQAAASVLINSQGDRPLGRLTSYLPVMSAGDRGRVTEKLAKSQRLDSETREILVALVGDRSRWVREQALQAIAKTGIGETEAVQLEGLLNRKAGDLRRGVLSLLLNQKDRLALASAERLLASANASQRLAGLDLLRQMAEAQRMRARCRESAQQHLSEHAPISAVERELLDTLLARERVVPTLDDALGLLDPAERTKPVQPRKRPVSGAKVKFGSHAAVASLRSLDQLVHEYRATPIELETWQGSQEELLGNVRWGFPSPNVEVPVEEDIIRLPLSGLWQEWWEQRPDDLRDGDSLELIRALTTFSYHGSVTIGRQSIAAWLRRAHEALLAGIESRKLRYPAVVQVILRWLIRSYPRAGTVDYLLDAVEAAFAQVPKRELARVPEDSPWSDWRRNSPQAAWLGVARDHRALCPELWHDAHHARLWGLLRWMDEPGKPVPRHRPSLEELMAAFQVGAATEADILDQLLGARSAWGYGFFSRSDLSQLTSRKPPPIVKRHPILLEIADRCRERIVEVELTRGDMPTAASKPALTLRSAGGTDALLQLLQRLGRTKFVRGWTYDSLSKAAVFSHLIRVTHPTETDDPADFAAKVQDARISQGRLIEVAVYAPQWAGFVERTLQWPGFEEAVWWLHAHTKDTSWRVDQQIREVWNAQIHDRTPLTGQDLLDGAVDVAWFHRVYGLLQRERWEALDRAARYASGGGGHKRAQLFADAMLGRAGKGELVARLTEKRHQDAARALGLLPLAPGSEGEDDLLDRYQSMQEFVRNSRKFGSQRQASERLAARIGMENLARTAGYPDPTRLEWAMEAREIADLAGGPITVSIGEVMVSLIIDTWGEPQETVVKGEQQLKAVPARVRKDPRIKELRARKRDLKRQATRMRRSLEQAMCRGDSFSGADLRELFAHPILAPMLEDLVFLSRDICGYPIDGGQALQAHDGRLQTVDDAESLRLAHPHDLLITTEWHLWQRECFLAERIQPFKQVFRELYVLTETERSDRTISRRYAGHQVNPRQAMALLGGRGWIAHPEEGVQRTFHDWGISAWIEFDGSMFTPAEVEGLTLEGIRFSERGDWKALDISQVPPRLFSEVMRDVDLVVSVAHRGGVDPEATASTVEMRSSLIRETCDLLKIENVQLQKSHALIEGQLGSYSVHLGSAVVHQQPGGALCIVPVHAQHRGRIFLPFVDDDPKTAEVLSKVLLLARDREITDPTILEQILARP